MQPRPDTLTNPSGNFFEDETIASRAANSLPASESYWEEIPEDAFTWDESYNAWICYIGEDEEEEEREQDWEGSDSESETEDRRPMFDAEQLPEFVDETRADMILATFRSSKPRQTKGRWNRFSRFKSK